MSQQQQESREAAVNRKNIATINMAYELLPTLVAVNYSNGGSNLSEAQLVDRAFELADNYSKRTDAYMKDNAATGLKLS